MGHIANYLSRAALLALALAAAGDLLAADAAVATVVAAGAVAQPAVFATVGDSEITQDEYNAAFNAAARGKFYHGKPPEKEIAELQRDVGERLVARSVLLHEVKQRGLRPDAAEIQKTLQAYERRYAGSEQWKKNREQMLPPLIARLEQDSLLGQLEKTVRASARPSGKDVSAYYAAHQDKFTEPEQLHVAVILLKVEPSAPGAAWIKVNEQAQAIAQRGRSGEDFAALARQYSADASAQQGGDMGYLHGGMLPDASQEALAKLKAGEMSDAVRVLEGFVIFRLIDRKPARLQEFDAVKERAQGLVQREQSDRVWTAFVADLKAKTHVQMDQSRFLPLPDSSGSQAAP